MTGRSFSTAFQSYQDDGRVIIKNCVQKNPYSNLFYAITLEGRRGTTDEFTTIPFHLVLFSSALVDLAKSIPVCRVPKCPTALNVRQILFFSKSVIMMEEITINSKINKYFKKIISEKYSESNLEKTMSDI